MRNLLESFDDVIEQLLIAQTIEVKPPVVIVIHLIKKIDIGIPLVGFSDGQFTGSAKIIDTVIGRLIVNLGLHPSTGDDTGNKSAANTVRTDDLNGEDFPWKIVGRERIGEHAKTLIDVIKKVKDYS